MEDVPSGTEFESEVCVIGAGVAGLLLSKKLAGYGFRIHLLEAGGIHLEQRSQDIYKSEMRGVFHSGATEGRFRTFGGASIRWGGQLLSYPDEVFQKRELLGHVGWPISEGDIRGYYPELFRVMGVNDLPFSDEFLERFGIRDALHSSEVRMRFSKFSPFTRRNLAKTLGRECLASDLITVFFHANAISVDLDKDGSRIQSVAGRNYKGGQYKFKALEYVICTGTIEASRLLLSSTSVHPRGIGNATDQVGRYFHDHVTVKALSVGEQSKATFLKYFSPYYVKNTLHSPKLEATPSLQKRLGLPEIMAQFFIHESDDNEFALLRQTLVDFQRGKFAIRTFGRLPLLLSGAARMAFALKVRGRRIVSPQANITLNIETEQIPRADSRIQISDEVNSLGMPQTIVDWKISDEEGEFMRRYAGVMDRFLKSLGMTQLDWNPGPQDDPKNWAQAGNDILHPMGGTRMGTSRANSVVDKELRVHGIDNLYVASCSVFPSGGSSNPTFTMMALTCRLADFLKQKQKR
ncbi:MAG TPA: GMC family oxidoreductase [Candidatus Methylacidiphilales bacterium]|jgi:choline dehydrogenase-like flavoprotein|nr:GMC family oxidoreductase [Candidatus Methylacidiphilales bacterium]